MRGLKKLEKFPRFAGPNDHHPLGTKPQTERGGKHDRTPEKGIRSFVFWERVTRKQDAFGTQQSNLAGHPNEIFYTTNEPGQPELSSSGLYARKYHPHER
jgi:hypothetical protein